jgi:hypothetical protein
VHVSHVSDAAFAALLPSSLAPSRLTLSPLSTVAAAQPLAGAAQAPGFSKALHAALAGHGGGKAAGRGRPGGAEELDAAARQAAHLAPPLAPSPAIVGATQLPMLTLPTLASTTSAATSGPSALTSLEEILPALVRKIAWSGDARRGAVRIELGAGALAGATLLVAADRGRVQVTLSAQADVELEPWRERIAARLAARGLDVDVT